MNRRNFLAVTSAGTAGSFLFPNILVAKESATLNVACIGVGGRGDHLLSNVLANDVNVVALADVDLNRSSKARKKLDGIPFYQDFRDMLSKQIKEIDAVVVATPDHTHHYIVKSCMKEGLPVYVEKPMTHSIHEARDLMQMEKETGLACQMGNQGHSSYGPFLAKEIMRAGIAGEISEVHAWTTHKVFAPFNALAEAKAVPETLDWDTWQGPVSGVAYSDAYLPGKWRKWNRFGGGALGDMGCHCMDVPYHALDLTYPDKIIPEFTEPRYKESFPGSVKITYRFPGNSQRGPVTLTWYHGTEFKPPRPEALAEKDDLGGQHGGSYMVGSKETVTAGGTGTPISFIPSVRRKELAPQLKALMSKNNVQARENDAHYQTYVGDHMKNWLDAVRGNVTANSNFAYAGRLTQVALLGNVAVAVNDTLKIDPETGDILDNPEAVKLAQGPEPRKGWEC